MKQYRVLMSVSDKAGLVDFSSVLADQVTGLGMGLQILSTGGTGELLQKAGFHVVSIADYTGYPEMMDGRLKTLHPKVHGGLLGRQGVDDAVMKHHDIPPIDMLVVNLYPFEATVADPDCPLERAIENIDIGGPAMIRGAAKNHASTVVIVDPADYVRVLENMRENAGCVSDDLRYDLALKAFELTARYDGAIANYLGMHVGDKAQKFPRTFNIQVRDPLVTRYGENWHQDGAFYRDQDPESGSIGAARQIHGKEMSYNNWADADAALECVKQFAGEYPTCVIVKHANPCGVAVGDTYLDAYLRAFSTDPESAFGGVIAFNGSLDLVTAQKILDNQFVEVIIVTGVADDALEVVKRKKNVRLLAVGDYPEFFKGGMDYKRVNGGLLVQDRDMELYNDEDLRLVSAKVPMEREMKDLQFAWRVAKFAKSNAIVLARSEMTIGVGAGQMSRINSLRIAEFKANEAGLQIPGAVMASDAFFPFRDGIDKADALGVSAVIQPGGSMRDEEVITAANEHDIAMVFTGMRHFRH